MQNCIQSFIKLIGVAAKYEPKILNWFLYKKWEKVLNFQ